MYKKRAVAAAATTAIALLGAGVGAAVADTTPLSGTGNPRIAGANRYETAVKVSQASFKAPMDIVFIASGESFADALGAGPAAAASGAPILLVQKTKVPQVVLDELTRLKPKSIAVVGGTGAISQPVMDAIAKYAPADGTFRISGSNRYATAAEVASGFDPGIPAVFIASGENFADALGGGAAAAHEGGALLLTAKGKLPTETSQALKNLKPQQVAILGGTGAVSASVETAINAATGKKAFRFSGGDRYETAAWVANDVWGTSKKVFMSSGLSFPDALAATPAAHINDAPILLTKGTCTPLVTQEVKKDLAPTLSVYLGGKTVTYYGTKVC
ncbi:Putative cell wall binding repeat 2 [Pedococcus cremeus]|uniref:Putative cell wall binding repeat 2 n=1 Tax=Pedococcus cremeus TaxID=587636 RepID=A0A1H9RPA7_9MICO|nr:cell wall-binding repeat-containing protein [Pedococcus cremeus]SER73719.1 Putative cell wall binding repeat 2 [Pedococcus cremeus]